MARAAFCASIVSAFFVPADAASCPPSFSGCPIVAWGGALPENTAACIANLQFPADVSEPSGGCCYYCGDERNSCDKSAAKAAAPEVFLAKDDIDAYMHWASDGEAGTDRAVEVKAAEEWFPVLKPRAPAPAPAPAPAVSGGRDPNLDAALAAQNSFFDLGNTVAGNLGLSRQAVECAVLQTASGNESSDGAAKKKKKKEVPRSRKKTGDENGGDGAGGDDPRGDRSDDEDEDEGACFPAQATVEMEDGSVKRMEDIAVGDVVKVGTNEFSRVFMFTHRTAAVRSGFILLETGGGDKLSLTSGHYLYVNGVLAAARTVSVGDMLVKGDGSGAVVRKVSRYEGEGLYNPQTVHGNLVVNGVLSSTYTTAVEPAFAHALLAPFRRLGLGWAFLENGSFAAHFLPKGAEAIF